MNNIDDYTMLRHANKKALASRNISTYCHISLYGIWRKSYVYNQNRLEL